MALNGAVGRGKPSSSYPPTARKKPSFGREPENAKDLHCKLTGADNLSEVLAWREERTVTKNLSMS